MLGLFGRTCDVLCLVLCDPSLGMSRANVVGPACWLLSPHRHPNCVSVNVFREAVPWMPSALRPSGAHRLLALRSLPTNPHHSPPGGPSRLSEYLPNRESCPSSVELWSLFLILDRLSTTAQPSAFGSSLRHRPGSVRDGQSFASAAGVDHVLSPSAKVEIRREKGKSAYEPWGGHDSRRRLQLDGRRLEVCVLCQRWYFFLFAK